MIRILEKEVADKIAAGEIIERPVSIVKELLENSIDAGARSVAVEIEKGGKQYIRVTDDGCGIPPEEVEKAFLRHATSKITSAEDLNSINTLGFRGEALASIAAVSRVELITKTAGSKTGRKICIEGGMIVENTGIGCSDGTTVIVKDLFFNTPARLKFMRSDAAESRLIIDLVSQNALAYPDIRFRMTNNKNILFSTRGKGDRITAISTLSGRDHAEELIPVKSNAGSIAIEGYVSGPGLSRAGRSGQIFFVNGRRIRSKIIEKAVYDAYKERLFEGRHPVAYLFIEIDPALVDVNVHPNKLEVKFRDEKALSSFVTDTLLEALKTKEAVPELAVSDNKIRNNEKKDIFRSGDRYEHQSFGHDTIHESGDPEDLPCNETLETSGHQVDIKNILSTYRNERGAAGDQISETSRKVIDNVSRNAAAPAGPFDFRELKYLGVIFDTYIIASDESSLYLLDQHAAHERINFEKLMDQFDSAEKAKQHIMVPITVKAGFREDGWTEALSKMGFEIEGFGPDTYAIRAIPPFFSIAEAEIFVNDFLENTDDDTDLSSRTVVSRIASNACKRSVKANDRLKNIEIIRLIDDLAKCDNPYSCPHGRPTFIRIGKYDIERRFKRK